MTSLNLRHEMRHSQTLSPRLQQAVRLLQLSSLDFAATLRDTLGKNPFLENEDGEELGEAAQAAAGDHAEHDAPEDRESTGKLDDGAADGERELWHADGAGNAPRADDSALSAMELMPAEQSLRAHLHGQLNCCRCRRATAC